MLWSGRGDFVQTAALESRRCSAYVAIEVRRERRFPEGRRDLAGSQRQHEGRETGDRQVDREEDPQYAD